MSLLDKLRKENKTFDTESIDVNKLTPRQSLIKWCEDEAAELKKRKSFTLSRGDDFMRDGKKVEGFEEQRAWKLFADDKSVKITLKSGNRKVYLDRTEASMGKDITNKANVGEVVELLYSIAEIVKSGDDPFYYVAKDKTIKEMS
jgi:hypothetical protein